jgi:hypothetical protein
MITALFWVGIKWVVGNYLPTFWHNLSVPSSGFSDPNESLSMGPIEHHEKSVRNNHYSLRNNPEDRSSPLQVIVTSYLQWTLSSAVQ